MIKKPKLDERQLLLARLWQADGVSWSKIGRLLGVQADTVRRWLDPEWRARRNAGIRKATKDRNRRDYHGYSVRADPANRVKVPPP